MNFTDDIGNCLTVLKDGGLILYPTDTIWGIGCDATNPQAVRKIFEIKSREAGKSLLILINGTDMLVRYVKELPHPAIELINVSEDPLTIIYPNGRNLADGVCAPDGSVGIRICYDDFCNELISQFRKPIVSTSANKSGMPSPAHYGEVDESIILAVDYTVNYRREDRQKHKASPVIKVENDGSFRIIRK